MHTKNQPSVVMKYYQRFEPLASLYARQVYNLSRIGFDFEDLLQEFKTKIYTSILAYAKRWAEYRATGRYKPVPIEAYVKSSLINKKKDIIARINEMPNCISIEATQFDFCEFGTLYGRIKPKEGIAEINGVDLVHGMSKLEARCFILFLSGFSIPKLKKVFEPKIIGGVESLINRQIDYLRQQKDVLCENQITSYKVYDLEEQFQS